ncbi:hypothetical protein NL676_013718 [Syzygium grande]|nr:hypothetical protein NL676_013718 [Syzygium grande]
MEAYPFDSPAHSSNSLTENNVQHKRRASSSHISSLYSLRKKMNDMTSKRPCKKMHIAPMPPVPKRVYTVDPADFKAVVQELTGAPTMAAAPAPAPPSILPGANCRPAAAATPPNDEDDQMSRPFPAVNPGLMSKHGWNMQVKILTKYQQIRALGQLIAIRLGLVLWLLVMVGVRLITTF